MPDAAHVNGGEIKMSDLISSVLEHHGVKGMKWGVRKDGSVSSTSTTTSRVRKPATDVVARQKPGQFVRTSGGKKQTASEDAVRVAAARQLAKKSTTDALTNKQLQDAVTRMNLEQQYATLSKKSDRRTRGQRFVNTLIGGGPSTSNNNQPSPAQKATADIIGETIKKAAGG